LRVHHDIYLVQLKKEDNALDDNAIPCINDQLTNARIRGGQILRKMDVSPWERREIFQLAFGAFHLTMNLIWGLLHTHLRKLGSPWKYIRRGEPPSTDQEAGIEINACRLPRNYS
jgi:hypothetical protein